MASNKYYGYREDEGPNVSRNGTPHRVSHAISELSQEEGREFQEFRRSMGSGFTDRIVGSFTKQMVKLAVEQLKPEFERMAIEAAGKALENKMVTIKEMQNELNRKEQELKRLQLEKKLLQAKFEKEKVNRDLASIVDHKEKEIKKLEADIGGLRGKLRKKAEELRKEKDRATEEEQRRVEIETKFNTEIDKLKRELDRVKGQLGQIRSAKNVGDEETRKLRDRERELLQELEDVKKQHSLRFLRKKLGN
ncbi:golgin subfamily A member 6-like protein 22 [Saccostrea echinata]|uniref:golgin subfamily A member 6-like protein 22 n=1 Tax=Saccostrea echinata TaxID=191078 RepID=UPI002A80509F|nr:golgin subfamily A member 6-like protein 22 [Saccostrea echinata]